MITAMHTLIYAEDPDAARAFFRDVLAFPDTDTGGGWLIFRTGPRHTRITFVATTSATSPPI